jgi:hypothetical protein
MIVVANKSGGRNGLWQRADSAQEEVIAVLRKCRITHGACNRPANEETP